MLLYIVLHVSASDSNKYLIIIIMYWIIEHVTWTTRKYKIKSQWQ